MKQKLNIKRALMIIGGAVLLMHLVVIVLSLSFNVELEYTDAQNNPAMLWLLAILSASVVSLIASLIYFKKEKVQRSAIIGLQFGLLANTAGFISSLLAFLPYKGGLQNYFTYFQHYEFWLAFVSIALTATIVGFLSSKEILKKQRKL